MIPPRNDHESPRAWAHRAAEETYHEATTLGLTFGNDVTIGEVVRLITDTVLATVTMAMFQDLPEELAEQVAAKLKDADAVRREHDLSDV